MKSRFAIAVALALPLASAASALAQQAAPVAVTPYVAVGTDGAAPVGVLVTVPLTTTLSAETEVAYRRGEGDIHAMSTSVSLLQHMPAIGRATPYVAAGVGLAQYGAPAFTSAGPPSGVVRRLTPTVNVGGGFKTPISDTMDFRTDVRYFDALGQGADQFRVANGISFGARRARP